ncbi:AMP-dependent synthetase and ligase [Rhizorhabdus wittichii RW1]|uniref:AMP-dependent synthetase and ligase n=1 Tax=Rhizorhabdus wittichii (strain DSM 6014 / CCUG 31198 / JCM 15750 / NBRC 105917 / EY 4224 / RW1) TaxID=392499 RepID=A0A9J9LDN4_RHIWR|nr:AMP-dependent synthetase and ligase [Rhizorhabdus wittichii RW1]
MMNQSDYGELRDLPRYQESVVAMLRATVRRNPELPALHQGHIRLTYGEYLAAVEHLADSLGAKTEGAVIAVALRNSIELAIVSFAVHFSGAALCLINPDYMPQELAGILADAAPIMTIGNEAFREKLEACGTDGGEFRLVVEGEGRLRVPVPAEPPILGAIGPDMLATIQYTGGTSGRPKGVELTHGAIAANIAQREAMLPTSFGGEKILCLMPMFHSFGTAMCLHLAAACGGELVIMPAYRPADTLAAIRQHGINLFPAGPTVYTSLLSFEETGPDDLAPITASYSGSAALPPDVLHRWEALAGSPIFEGYGQTEAGPILTYNSPSFERRAGSVGKPLPFTSVRIVDGDGLPCAQGTTGEIWASGPQIMRGYRNLPNETSAALGDGWLRTGDLGHFDEDGYLFIDGRKKEMAIIKGYNVYPVEVDNVLFQHPGILEAATVATKDGYRGEVLYAFVAPRPDASLTTDSVEAWCRDRLVRYKVPSMFVLLTALPKTAIGKIDKTELARSAARMHGSATSAPAA